MKNKLLLLLAGLLIFQGGMSYAATSETTGIFTTLKNAIIKDVQSAVTTSVTTAANKALNTVALAKYKKELEAKKQELAELEASKINFISKFFKRRKLNREIKDLEQKIKDLEG